MTGSGGSGTNCATCPSRSCGGRTSRGGSWVGGGGFCLRLPTQPTSYLCVTKLMRTNAQYTISLPQTSQQGQADLIKANPTRNFIGCIIVQELEKFPEAEFLIRPWGPCDQFFLRSNYTEEETIEERDNYVAEKIGLWPHGISFIEGLPPHSWESVSNNEMWQGKIRHAM